MGKSLELGCIRDIDSEEKAELLGNRLDISIVEVYAEQQTIELVLHRVLRQKRTYLKRYVLLD